MNRKTIMIAIFASFFASFAYADKCVINMSVANFGTIYDQIRYKFIPFSARDPLNNGGAQFFIKYNDGWVASTPTKWGTQLFVSISNTTNCSSIFNNNLDIEVAYADFTNDSHYNVPPTNASTYCLAQKIALIPDSGTILIPQFGPNNGYWQPC